MSAPACFPAMGCTVVVGGDDRDAAAARELFADWEQTFSRFVAGSELNRVNAAPTPAVRVSARFATAVAAALRAVEETGGLVDPTLHDALVTAGYDRDFDDLAPAAGAPGTPATGRPERVRLVGRLLLRPAGLRLDLNGVVKAMAVDAALAATGATFVAAGGDLAARTPIDVGLPGGDSVRLAGGGMATSGSVTRRWLRGGRAQHHLIAPRTGRPAETPWAQVTVAGGDCLAADVAAKAAFLLGEDGPGWLDALRMPGRFVAHDGAVVVSREWCRGAVPCT